MNVKGIFKVNKSRFILVILLLLLNMGLSVGGQYLETPMFNYLKQMAFMSFLAVVIVSVGMQLLAKVLQLTVNYLYLKQVQEYNHQARLRISRHFFAKNISQTAKVQNNLLTNLTTLTENYATPLGQLWGQGLNVVASIGVLFSFNWILVVLTVAFSAISLYVPKLFEKKNSQAMLKVTKENEKLLDTIQKWSNGLDELRRYAGFGIFTRSIDQENNTFKHVQIKQGRQIATSDVVNSCVNIAEQMILTLVASWLYLDNQIVFGAVMTSTSFAGNVMSELDYIIYEWNKIKSTKQIRTEMLELQAELPQSKNDHLNEKLDQIKITNLACKFNNGEEISYPDLTLKKGEKVLLTGDSGTGKSTLLKLLLGQLKPSHGQISYLDEKGQNLQLNLDELGYIAQDSTLFPDTIKNNIAMFDSKLDRAAVQAAEAVDLQKDLDKMPHGIDNQVNLDRDNLSGGQKQKIVLARSLAHANPWLFIDEGTSAIDAASTKKILQNLLKGDNSVVMIAHNYSAELVNMFDRQIKLGGESHES